MSSYIPKKLINDTDHVVRDCLEGVVSANPGLSLLKGHSVVLRSDLSAIQGQVAVISGGGSGHEPATALYVGQGLLTSAVCGQVFASPPVKSILAAMAAVWNFGKPSGILLVITNYTGDRVNFGLALERARAKGILCDMVVVGEDCALTTNDKSAGRRGLAGTMLVHKIAGAMAVNEVKLEDIVVYLKTTVLNNIATVGLCLFPCSLPGRGPTFTLGQGNMELGLGVHGEAGFKRTSLKSADESVAQMLDHMTNAQSATSMDISPGEEIVILINNLGTTSHLEMGIVTKSILDYAKRKFWNVRQVLAGPFMTSLEMAGISITMFKIKDNMILKYLDWPVSALAWPRCNTFPEDYVGDGKIMDP